MGLCGGINQKKRKQNNQLNNSQQIGQVTKPDYSKKLRRDENVYPSPPSAGKIGNDCVKEVNTNYPNLDSISISEAQKNKVELNQSTQFTKNQEKKSSQNQKPFIESKNQSKREKEIQEDINYPKQSQRKDTISEYEEDKQNNNYDIVIDIDSIRNLNTKGWEIKYIGDKNKLKSIIEENKKVIISVLGNSNRGKTYLLQKLSGINLKSGYQIQTKGLSLKFYKGQIIYLDTAGTNTPLLIENDNKRPNKKEEQDIHLCQILTNYIIQTFVIEYAQILICVVGMLNASEQQFLNKIKRICENKKELIVIHNLVKCTTIEDIKKYKEDILLNLMSNKLEERPIPDFGEKYTNLFNKYFIEKGNNNVRHFIYGNDQENNEKMNYYNICTLNYIRTCINVEIKKQNDLFKNLNKHLKKISSLVLYKDINPVFEKEIIKCKEEINPKEILADELDNIIFIGKEYEPVYRYYRNENDFIIEIDLCSKYNKLEISQVFDRSTKETIFKISGERKIELDGKSYFINKRESYKNFKLEIKVILAKIGFKHVNKECEKNLSYGILFLTFNGK